MADVEGGIVKLHGENLFRMRGAGAGGVAATLRVTVGRRRIGVPVFRCAETGMTLVGKGKRRVGATATEGWST